MRRMCRPLLACMLLLIVFTCKAQSFEKWNRPRVAGIEGLNIGDVVPDFTINKMVNSDRRSVNIAEFKDRLLIFDYWGTGCAPCIAALPDRDALQKEFGDRIKIIAVTHEKEDYITKFWKTNRYTRNLTIPTVVEDSIIASYFQFNGGFYPQIWIYKGKLIGNTAPEYIDANNIRLVLNGYTPNWPVMSDEPYFDPRKQSIFSKNEIKRIPNASPLKYAAMKGYMEKNNISAAGAFIEGRYDENIIRDPKNRTIRIFFLNTGIYNIYQWCWLRVSKKNPKYLPCRNIWEVEDKEKYVYTRKPNTYSGDWHRKNAICFESVQPDTGQTDEEVYLSVIKELDRQLGLIVRWEQRTCKVYNLVRTSDLDKFRNILSPVSNHLEGNYRAIVVGPLHKLRQNSMNYIVREINKVEENPLVFDSTKYVPSIDMELEVPSWTDIDAIRKELMRYDLDLEEEYRKIDVFVFTELPDRKAGL